MEDDDDEKLEFTNLFETSLPTTPATTSAKCMETHNERFVEALGNPTAAAGKSIDFGTYASHVDYLKRVGRPDNYNGSDTKMEIMVDNKLHRSWRSNQLEDRINFYCRRNSEWKLSATKITALIPHNMQAAHDQLQEFYTTYCLEKNRPMSVDSAGQPTGVIYLRLFNQLTTAAYKRALKSTIAENDDAKNTRDMETNPSIETVETLKLFPTKFLLLPQTFRLNTDCPEIRHWLLDREFAELQRQDYANANKDKSNVKEVSCWNIDRVSYNKLTKRIDYAAKLRELLSLMLRFEPFATLEKLAAEYPTQICKLENEITGAGTGLKIGQQASMLRLHLGKAAMNEDARWLSWLYKLNPAIFNPPSAVEMFSTTSTTTNAVAKSFVPLVYKIPVKNACYLLKNQLLTELDAQKFFAFLLKTSAFSGFAKLCEKLFEVFLYLGNFYALPSISCISCISYNDVSRDTKVEMASAVARLSEKVEKARTSILRSRPTAVWKAAYNSYLAYAELNGLEVATTDLSKYKGVLDTIFSKERKKIQELGEVVNIINNDSSSSMDQSKTMSGLLKAIAVGDVDWLRENSDALGTKESYFAPFLRRSTFVSVRQFFVEYYLKKKADKATAKAAKVAAEKAAKKAKLAAPAPARNQPVAPVDDEDEDIEFSDEDDEDEDEDEYDEEDETHAEELKVEILCALKRESLETIVEMDKKLPILECTDFYQFAPLPKLLQNPDERVLDYFLQKQPEMICGKNEDTFRILNPRIFVYLMRRPEFINECADRILSRLFIREDGYPGKFVFDYRMRNQANKKFIFKLFLLLGNFSTFAQQDELWRQVYQIYLDFIDLVNTTIRTRALGALMLQYFV